MISIDFSSIDTTPTRKLTLSPQQERVLSWVKDETGNAIIIAVAGSGKTTTLIEALAAMTGTVAFAAYNKRIADEIKEKVAKRQLSADVRVGTFHSFGFRAWTRQHPRVKVDGFKIRNLIEAHSTIPEELQEFIAKLVSLVRNNAVGIVTPMDNDVAWDSIIDHYGLIDSLEIAARKRGIALNDEDIDALVEQGKRWAQRILQESIEQATTIIDFDDQLYMPLYARIPIDQYDWVLVDEAQDSNPTRRALAAAMLRSGGRFIAVGDPAQAIYGFTGADSESLDNIEQEFGCISLNLTVSYRCPKRVVEVAQRWVSHIEAADDAPDGMYTGAEYHEMLDAVAGTPINALQNQAVLCRKNAPLVDLAFMLIRSHIPCHVEGRDIGAQIKNLVKRWKTNDLAALRSRIDAHKQREVAKLIQLRQEARADVTADRCDTATSLIDGLLAEGKRDVRDLFDLCDRLFGDNVRGGLTLSSIHKAKGREWKTVYWLGAGAYQPSPFAKQEWQMRQEFNLMYVAATRAQETLVSVAANA